MLMMVPDEAAQMRPCGAAQSHRAIELQPETIGPVRLGQREEIAALGRACVVDQDVDPAESRHRLGHDGRGASGFVRSTACTRHASPSGEASSSSCARERATTTRRMPSCASVCAMARPMPLLAPVTMATLF